MDSFDYIVVGGGTAGCVLAARLSQNPVATVLLLEAGAAQPTTAMADPAAWTRLAGTSVDWAGKTLPQVGTGAVHPWPRGKILGGSSGINGLMHIRGDRASYDRWESDGAPGWGYDDLLPFMKRSESTEVGEDAYRGRTGPMRVGPFPRTEPLFEACFAASVEAGHARVEDGNGPTAEGTSWNENTVVDGKRQTAADAYLAPALRRPNLTIVTDALVRRIVIDHGICRGVEYRADGTAQTAHAGQEVVVTAGAVGTPQLLLLSGIGPGQHLRELGVGVAADLPGVGANLQDHPKSQVVYRAKQPVRTGRFARKPHVLLRSEPSAEPDLQIIFLDLPVHPRWMPGPEDGYSLVFSLMTPASRGSVRLASTDPERAPLIDPQYLSDPDDLVRLAAGLHMAREVGEAPALAPFRSEELFPGTTARSEVACRAYLRRSTTSYSHAVGTCRIGTGQTSVVDPHLRVHGVERLRIADASVMPSVPSGNTNASVLAIAERAASFLTGD